MPDFRWSIDRFSKKNIEGFQWNFEKLSIRRLSMFWGNVKSRKQLKLRALFFKTILGSKQQRRLKFGT